tara:strand:- start:1070 stop:1522 length:453 start_codon:yes stop_codon:yes gene_type:complete
MENLLELSNQLDSIKEKLTDKEYKDLMELTKKINDNKKRYVKCLVGIIQLNIYEKEEEDNNMELNMVGNCYKHQGYDQSGTHNVYITPNVSFEEKIFEVREVDDGTVHLNVDENWICNTQYDMLKKDKYDHLKFPNNSDYDIVVYLCDMP